VGLTAFTFERGPTAEFVDLAYRLHRGQSFLVPPLRKEILSQLAPAFPFYARPGNDHRRFLARAGGRVVARAMASVDDARRDASGALVGAIGFFETEDDYAAAADVLGAAAEWLRSAHGIRRIRGPLNFDIWHGYRLMTRGFERERFFGEPCNPRHYPAFFERFGFSVCRRWHSFEMAGDLPGVGLRAGERTSRELAARGYRFEPFGARPFAASVSLLHDVLTRSFAAFPGFTPIALPDFLALTSLARVVVHPGCSTFAFDETGTLAGFTAVFLDVAHAMRAMNGSASLAARARFWRRRRTARRLLMHLGGITPAEAARRTGLGRALFHHTADLVRAERRDEVLGTLVAEGNPVRRFFGCHAADDRREYALYEMGA
jgi:hypothetical protein